jgi:glycosyltransferase involved in cell wall biosynthesis
MLSKIYNRIYNAFIWRWNVYFWHPVNRLLNDYLVKQQEEDALIILNGVMAREPVSEIRKKIKGTVSNQLNAVLRKVEQTGYITDLPEIELPIKISIVIPHYNHAHLIGETLESLFRQTAKPFEIIIVDDVSKDIEVLEKVITDYLPQLNITLIKSKEKLYTGKARQRGAELATGNLIMVTDADDPFHPQALEFAEQFFINNKRAVALMPSRWEFYGQFNYDAMQHHNSFELFDSLVRPEKLIEQVTDIFRFQLFSKKLGNGVYRGGSFGGGSLVYRQQILNTLRWSSPNELIDNSFTDWEDYEFSLMLFLLSQQVYKCTLPMVSWRRDSTTNKVWW